MAKQKQWTPNSFVNYSLSKSNIAALRSWYKDHFGDTDWLLDLTTEGLKVTFSYFERTDTYSCWLVPMNEADENYGLILSGRGSSPTSALVECVFKHRVLFKGKWPKPTADGSSWTWDREED